MDGRRREQAIEDLVGEAWRSHRRFLLDVAYRMLGSVADAEDVVQEGFTRLLRTDSSEIEDVRGWLVVVVGRLCLDHLKSSRVRREAYVGPWFPEPVVTAPGHAADPAERITLDESVRMALLVVLEKLSPAERAAFVLHDIFQFSFKDVGSIVGRSPESSRQLASRARKHIQDETGPARFDVDHQELRAVTERFIAASSGGDIDALMQVLDPNVTGWTDAGGLEGVPLTPNIGRSSVAKQFLWFVQTFDVRLEPMPINGEPGVVCFAGDRLISFLTLETRDGRISRIHGFANPQKLAYAARVLGVEMYGATAESG